MRAKRKRSKKPSEAVHMSRHAEVRKNGVEGAGGEKRRACHPPSAQPALSVFWLNTISPPPASYFQLTCVWMTVCVCLWESESVLEVRFGAEAIKALLKHFCCCWLMLKQKESRKKKRRSETVREGARSQWLSGAAQQSAGSLSILWAERCEMSQQPNSNIKLSWAAQGKSRMDGEERVAVNASSISWPSLLQTF